MVLTLGLVFGNPIADGIITKVAFAGGVPLADIGLRYVWFVASVASAHIR